MPRYIDSGSDDPDQYLGNWLNANLVEGIQSFRCQSGYFAYSALASFSQTLHDLSAAGKPVHFVLGSNSGSLTTSDLEPTLEVVQGTSSGSLTVVAYRAGLFHPKTIHIVRSDGSAVAVVGSSNFTEQGLGLNVEASVVLDTSDGDDAMLVQQVADAIDRWRILTEEGVFSITSLIDIQKLTIDGVINLPQPPRPVAPPAPPAGGTGPTGTLTLGSRRRRWQPAKSNRQPKAEPPAQTPPLPPALQVALAPLRWCKRLKGSDAQQNAGHKIAQLRLTKSVMDIDHRTFFRAEMFGNLAWVQDRRRGHDYDMTQASFLVTIRGRPIGTRTLAVHYAPHQEQSQNNYTSVIYWDDALKQELRSRSYVDDWVVLERDGSGHYSLTVQQAKPGWATQVTSPDG